MIKFTFCHFNDYRNLAEAYETNPDLIHQRFGVRNETILHRAALNRRIEMVEFLLEHEAMQCEDGNGNTPLHCAGNRIILRGKSFNLT